MNRKKKSASGVKGKNKITPPDFIVSGTNENAEFTLKAYRGERTALLAMNWKKIKSFPGILLDSPLNKGIPAEQNSIH